MARRHRQQKTPGAQRLLDHAGPVRVTPPPGNVHGLAAATIAQLVASRPAATRLP